MSWRYGPGIDVAEWFQALLGFNRTLIHLDGRTIPLTRRGTTQPGEVEVIEGEGVGRLALNCILLRPVQMPAFQDVSQGDIYIEYSVVFPTEVSESSRKSMNLLHLRCPTPLTCKQSSLISSDRPQDQPGRKTSCRFLTLHIQHALLSLASHDSDGCFLISWPEITTDSKRRS